MNLYLLNPWSDTFEKYAVLLSLGSDKVFFKSIVRSQNGHIISFVCKSHNFQEKKETSKRAYTGWEVPMNHRENHRITPMKFLSHRKEKPSRCLGVELRNRGKELKGNKWRQMEWPSSPELNLKIEYPDITGEFVLFSFVFTYFSFFLNWRIKEILVLVA